MILSFVVQTKKHPGWGGGRKRSRVDPPQFVMQQDESSLAHTDRSGVSDSESSWSSGRSAKSSKYPTVAHSLFGTIKVEGCLLACFLSLLIWWWWNRSHCLLPKVADEEGLKEKDRALRNLDMLLAIAEERDHDPEFIEVCGFRVRK